MSNPGVKAGGIDSVVEMMRTMEEGPRETLLKNLAARDPKLVEEIRKRLFVFEDLVKLPGSDLQILLRGIPGEQLALALRGTTESLRAAVLENLSIRAQEALLEELSANAPVPAASVRAVQEKVVAVLRKLSTDGKISAKIP